MPTWHDRHTARERSNDEGRGKQKMEEEKQTGNSLLMPSPAGDTRRHLPPFHNRAQTVQRESCNEHVLVETHLHRSGLVQFKWRVRNRRWHTQWVYTNTVILVVSISTSSYIFHPRWQLHRAINNEVLPKHQRKQDPPKWKSNRVGILTKHWRAFLGP